MLAIIVEIIQNLAVLVLAAALMVAARRVPWLVERKPFLDAVFGLILGFVILEVMLDPIRLEEGAVFDLRSGPAILAGVFGGPIAAVIAGVIGAAVRIFIIGGPFAIGGAIGFICYAIFGVLAGMLIRRYQLQIGLHTLFALAFGGVVAVMPAFFIGHPLADGMAVLAKAGPLLTGSVVLSVVVLGFAIERLSALLDHYERTISKEAESRKLARVARDLGSGITITDKHGRIEWVNEGFEILTGYRRQELTGRVPGHILQGRETDQETVKRMRTAIASGEPFDADVLNYRKDGTPYWAHIHCEPLTQAGEDDRLMAVQTDITEQKRYEQQLLSTQKQLESSINEVVESRERIKREISYQRRLTDELKVARDAAESANTAKSEFLATMSHEIRTPMTTVMGFADLLLMDNLAPESRDKIYKMKDASRGLLRIINDILDMSKLDAGKIELEKLDFHLPTLVHDVVELFNEKRSDTRAKRLDISIDIADDVPHDLHADPTRLRQVLINLIGNAVKFTERGSVRISITFEGPADRLNICFAVTDTGIGIKPEVLPHLFTAFTQADPSISRRFEGTGLGLAICRRLVELQGGTIGVESDYGAGSRFHFTLPYESAKTEITLSGQREMVTFASLVATRQLRILVAEDNTMNQQILRSIVGALGHQTTIVDNGLQAVEKLDVDVFDLILMDVRMPIMSGPDATRVIRERQDQKAQIPIIALTADVMSEHRRSYIDAGMNAVVAKPIEAGELAETMDAVLNEQVHTAMRSDDPTNDNVQPPNGSASNVDPGVFDDLILEMTKFVESKST